MTAATPTADSKSKRQSAPRKAETYRAARRNLARVHGGLSTKRGPNAPQPQKAIAYKQTREAARRLRQRARKAA